jgi:hypothetical protein
MSTGNEEVTQLWRTTSRSLWKVIRTNLKQGLSTCGITGIFRRFAGLRITVVLILPLVLYM